MTGPEKLRRISVFITAAERLTKELYGELGPGPTDADYEQWQRMWHLLSGLREVGETVRRLEKVGST